MESTTPIAHVSKAAIWTGRILTALPVLMLVMSGVMKIMQTPEVVKGFASWPAHSAVVLGIVELAVTAIYLVPRTAVLGAILVTGYFGGAIAVTAQMGANFAIPLMLGVLVWGGLWLRDTRVRALIPLQS